jgi:cathepsin X
VFYTVDSFGTVLGEEEMMNEIAARGPISCSLNSDAAVFDQYTGGIITCQNSTDLMCHSPTIDHVVVIAGYGYDSESGMKYWVGRNSYGSFWGEGAGMNIFH